MSTVRDLLAKLLRDTARVFALYSSNPNLVQPLVNNPLFVYYIALSFVFDNYCLIIN